jgi:OOP family OmpA-OmpF porin
MNKINLLAASLAVASSTCLAGAPPPQFLQRTYIGLNAGQSTSKMNSSDFAGPAGGRYSDDKTDSAYKVYGGYTFNPMWAIEGGYAGLGTANRTFTPAAPTTGSASIKHKNSALFVKAKATFPVGNAVGLFGTLGVSSNKTTATYLTSIPGDTNTSGTHTQYSPVVGLGAEWAWKPNVGVRFEYEDYGKFGNQANTGRSKMLFWSVGLTYAF